MERVSGRITVDGNRLVFTPLEPFPENSRIRIRLRPYVAGVSGKTLKPGFELEFLTHLHPFYSSIRQIRLDIGKFIEDVSDLDIARVIHQVSKWADQVAAKPYGSLNSDFPGETQRNTDNRIFFHLYTRWESDIQLLLRNVADHMPDRSQSLQVGDWTRRSPGSLSPEISVVLTRLEQRRNEALRYLKLGEGTYPGIHGATLGAVGNPYPFEARNSF